MKAYPKQLCPRKLGCSTLCIHGYPHDLLKSCKSLGEFDQTCPRCVDVDDSMGQAEQWIVYRWLE